jgi:tetratricopeptide (TPR) repeat protein
MTRRANAKFSLKDHPIVIAATIVVATTAFWFGVLVPIHHSLIDQKDRVIKGDEDENKRLSRENDDLRKRLAGEVILVSTNELQSTKEEITRIEKSFSSQLQSVSASLSQLNDIKSALGKSLKQQSTEDHGELRRIANIRPDGRSVNWLAGKRGSGGMASSGPSEISEKLSESFSKFNQDDLTNSIILLTEIENREPLWPYSYFYLGLSQLRAGNPSIDSFKEAEASFAKIRSAGINEPELLLYEAMTQILLGNYEDARALLNKLSEFHENVEDLTVLVATKTAPKDLVEKIATIAEKNKMGVGILEQPH